MDGPAALPPTRLLFILLFLGNKGDFRMYVRGIDGKRVVVEISSLL